jgi:multidrug efflux system outer membrane protein
LVAAVATAYFTLREQDHEREIAERTLKSRRDSLELITVRQQGGQGALTDVRQAEVLVAEAEAAMKAIERQVAKLEHEISYLCGRVPAEVRRGRPFVELSSMVTAPAGLPSDLLNRRPDIRRAEQNLVAATAAVGEAEARRYPAFALTAGAGLRSDEFSGLLSDPVKFWQVGPALTVPVFTGGRLRAGVAGAKAGRDEAEAAYRRTVLQGMREVSDALVAVEKNAGLREAQGKVVAARTAAAGLIRDRWDNGVASYLEVLYNDQELFQAELNHARARLEELTAGISLYRALGGGWGRE